MTCAPWYHGPRNIRLRPLASVTIVFSFYRVNIGMAHLLTGPSSTTTRALQGGSPKPVLRRGGGHVEKDAGRPKDRLGVLETRVSEETGADESAPTLPQEPAVQKVSA